LARSLFGTRGRDALSVVGPAAAADARVEANLVDAALLLGVPEAEVRLHGGRDNVSVSSGRWGGGKCSSQQWKGGGRYMFQCTDAQLVVAVSMLQPEANT